MGSSLLIGLAFLTGFLLVFGANLILVDLFQRGRREVQQRLEEELLLEQREMARAAANVQKDLGRLSEEAYLESSGEKQRLAEKLRDLIAQAGMRLSVSQLAARSLCVALAVGLLGAILTGSITVTLVGALLGGAIPGLYVYQKREKRLETLRSQLPDAFDLMSRVLRAGQTMSQAMLSVSEEMKPPVAVEFAYCYEQQNLGLAPEFALRDLARRTGLLEIKIFVLALLVHRQSGGNLTELLDKLGTIVRDRYRLRAKVKGLTAEGRLQGIILLFLPVVVYAMMFFFNRNYAVKLLAHPMLMIGTLTAMTIGAVWIRRIVNFEF